ncbi:MAG: hypothetical protein M1819_007474 [Sarea resinae]|nr:MAG: hypothetical protein M1819_007474 [Sarea resinae]
MFTPRDNTPPETTTTVDPDASPAERSSTRRCYSLPSSWRQSEGRFSLGLNIPPSLRRRQPTRSSSFLLGRRPSRESQSSREGSSQQSEPSPPLSPFRSVSGMKKPFPLMLSEPGSPSTSDLSAHKTLPAQNIFPISQSATLPPATSTQTSHQMEDSSLLIGTEPCAIKGSDSQNESGSSESTIATDDFNCPCSAPGSPCEELCILSDYGVSDEATPSPEEDDQVWFESLSRCSTLQIGLSDLLNPNLEKACVPGVAETLETHGCHPRKPASLEPSPMEKPMKLKSALNDEAQWLGGSLEMTSWLDDVEGSDCDGDYPMKQSALFSASSRDESSISLTPLIQDGMDESISYATTLTPRKPIVVHVRRSSASLDASSITKSSSLRSGNSGLQTPKISTKRAHNDATWTPPDTPEHVEKLKLAAQQQENKSASSDSSYTANEKPERTAKKAAVGDFATPPHSPDIIHLPSSSSSASTLTPSEIELRIASLLEDSVRGFPATMLQLDSPVIELIRDKHILSTPSLLSIQQGRLPPPGTLAVYISRDI